MLLIVGSLRIDPARLDEARPALERMMQESRLEPGCIQFDYAENLFDPGLIHVIERWRNREAMAGHFSSPHLLEWRSSYGRLGIHDCDLTLYDCDRFETI